jgi:membrane protease YdiL (CAAX protease family)
MNHLESSVTGKNAFWRYLIMLVAVLVASNTIGSVPLIVSMLNNPEAIDKLAVNPNDLSPLGLDPNLALIYMLVPFIAGLATFVLLVKPLNLRSFGVIINGTNNFRWNRFFISGLVWTVISAIYLFISIRLDPGNFTLNNTAGTLIPLILISILLIPFQATFEEVLFRGYLMQGFAVLFKNRFFPLIITSVLFSLMHSFNPEIKEFGFWTMMPQYILFGLIFGVMTILDDGIETAMGAHTANNAFLCIMVTNEASALQTPALYEQHDIQPWFELATMLVMGIVIILILKIIFRWKGFSALFSGIELKKSDIYIS